MACGCGSPTQPTPSPTPALPEAAGWQLLANSPPSPAQNRHDDIFFVSPTAGWLVNTRGEVHKTVNGGETWSLVHLDPTVSFRSVGFASETLGWAGNLNLSNPPEPGIGFASAELGWVAGVDTYETRDGGPPGGPCTSGRT